MEGVLTAWQEREISVQALQVLVAHDRLRCCKIDPTSPEAQLALRYSVSGTHKFPGATGVAGGTGWALAPQVLEVVVQELHCKEGQAGVPPVHTPVRRWVMEPVVPLGHARVWFSLWGAHMQDSSWLALKVCFSPRKRNVTLVVGAELHCAANKFSLVMSPRAFCKLVPLDPTNTAEERSANAGINFTHCSEDNAAYVISNESLGVALVAGRMDRSVFIPLLMVLFCCNDKLSTPAAVCVESVEKLLAVEYAPMIPSTNRPTFCCSW